MSLALRARAHANEWPRQAGARRCAEWHVQKRPRTCTRASPPSCPRRRCSAPRRASVAHLDRARHHRRARHGHRLVPGADLRGARPPGPRAQCGERERARPLRPAQLAPRREHGHRRHQHRSHQRHRGQGRKQQHADGNRHGHRFASHRWQVILQPVQDEQIVAGLQASDRVQRRLQQQHVAFAQAWH